jgi:hypothetical protein
MRFILDSAAPVIFFQQRERKIDAGGEASRGVEIAVLNPDRPGVDIGLGIALSRIAFLDTSPYRNQQRVECPFDAV